MASHPTHRDLTRREFHGLCGLAALAAAAPWLPGRAAAEADALATELPENEALLGGLQFVSESQKEGQQCGSCFLYREAGGGKGHCQLIQKGLVPERGWCLSWAQKP